MTKILKYKNTPMLITMLAMFILLIGVVPAVAQTGATYTLTPAASSIEVGETVIVTVGVQTNGNGINTAQLELDYDPTILQVNSATVNGSQPLTVPLNTAGDDGNGQILFAHGIFSSLITTDFDYVTIEFEGIGVGTSGIIFGTDSTTPTTLEPNTIIYDVPSNGSIEVTSVTGPTTCPNISTLDCSQVPVSLPFSLDWDANEGGLSDSGVTGTGFTMAMEPTARLAGDGPISFADAPGYEPSKLTVDTANSVLEIEATKGIFYRSPGVSGNTNSQINGLAVGFDASQAFEVTTTLVNPAFDDSSGSSAQQAGLWFGLDEDNVIKLVVAKTGETSGKIQLQVEDAVTNGTAVPIEVDSPSIANITTSTIELRLVVDTTNNEVSAFYSIDGGTEQALIEASVSTIAFGSHFLTGVDHDSDGGTANVSYAGVHSTLRNAAATPAITFEFDDFSITEQSTADTTPPVITLLGDDPLELTVGDVYPYTEPNATATDDVDGDITANIIVGGDTVDMATEGTYVVTYNVSDAAGNPATEVSRTVNVNPATVADGQIIILKDAQPDSGDTFSFTGDLGAFDIVDDGNLFSANINFQATGAAPAGYTADYGGIYSLGQGYGWFNALDDQPIDASGNARNREASITLENTLMHLRYNECCTGNGLGVPVYWGIDLPNGVYQVTVNLGDFNAEGSNTANTDHVVDIEGFIFNTNGQFPESATGYVVVTDGQLNIDEADDFGAVIPFNTKINYIEIQQVSGVGFSEAPGNYAVTESATSGWTLDSLVCSDDSLTDVGTATATISLAEAETVICTFTNVLDVVDEIPPVITLIGDNPQVIEVGAGYVEFDATATDEPGTVDISDDIVIDASAVDAGTVGSYSVTYNVSDAAGNPAAEVTRTVDVVDTTAPVITLIGDNPLELTVGDTFTDPGYTATDNYDGDISGSVVVGGSVDTNTANTYILTYDVTDVNGNTAVQVSREVIVNAPIINCPLISTLDCSLVPVTVPFVLDWNADEGGMVDSVNVGTGFTMVMAPSARLTVDNPVAFADVPGYEPSKLNVDTANSVLEIEATKGIFYYNNNPNNTTDANSQINGLGVGFDASQDLEITTTLVNPAFNVNTGSTNTQQAGLWFGLDEDNVIKLVVVKTGTTSGKIQLQVEDAIGTGINTQPVELNSGGINNITTATIDLRLVVDATNNEVSGFYSINGGTEQQVVQTIQGNLTSELPFGNHFLTGVDHDSNAGTDAVSFAGVHGTLRRGDANTPITFEFADFAISIPTPPDMVAPIITVLGDNPLELTVGDVYPYTEPNATALDDVDGSIGVTVAGNDVDVNNVGSYSVDYTSTDAAGNVGNASRVVNVSAAPVASTIIITEIMYDPNSPEDNWEWIEIYNNGLDPIDLTGYVVDDTNGSSHTVANIAGGTINAGTSAILYNADDVSAGEFSEAWGTVDLVAVTNWVAMGLNNGGDQVSIWNSFASYSGDHVTHANAIHTVNYAAGFPDPVGTSIYLTDLNADNTVGSNWAINTVGVTTPLYTAYTSASTAAGNTGTDVGSPGIPPQQPLLLSEIVVTPTEGEFIEIYNPGSSAVDLSDVYLTDATFTGNPSTYYYNIVTGVNAGGGNFGDFFARFPDGASIDAGEYQTVAIAGSDAFFTEYGIDPTYELFEDGVSADSISDMREAFSGSIGGQGGITNGGEFVVLFAWDGVSDLVIDLDYAVWGDKAEAVDKTGISIDGPDADSDISTYQNDTAIVSQDVIDTAAHAIGVSWQRDDLSEGAEVKSGGNGAAGHDETSEDLSNTWCSNVPTPNAVSDCTIAAPTEYFIYEIQGSGSEVTTAINESVKVTAIVVGDYQNSDQLSGFFIQEENSDADGDLSTSDGIFVFCSSCTDVAVGDLVEVIGVAGEFSEMSQISASSVSVISSGNALPTPATVDLPAPAGTDQEATFESVEGMLVSFADTLTVSEYFELARYGQIILSEGGRPRQFTDANAPSVAGYAAHLEDVARRQIILDDDNNIQNAPLGGNSGDNPALDTPYYHPVAGLSDVNFFRGGDTIATLTGIMHWSGAGFSNTDAWRIRPVPESFNYNFSSTNPRLASPATVGGTFKVASFNVLNYFQTLGSRGANSSTELQRQTDKIVDAICEIDADVVGLIEIENDGGVSLNALLNAINAECGTYAGVNTGVIGSDEIAVAFIYKTGTATTVGNFAILDSSVDSTFIDTKNRPALAQTFEETATGGQVTVVVNHLKSKGSSCDDVSDPDLNDGQANCSQTRTDAAQAISNWLASDPTASSDSDFLIIGDLNSYRNEDPITALETAGYTDLIDLYLGANGYSYVFDGQLGYLDYALANNSLLSQVTGLTTWNINADEIPVFDYNDDIQDSGEGWFVRESTALDIYEPDAYRSSDHDPVIVGLNLTAPNPADETLIGTIQLQGRDDSSSVETTVIVYPSGSAVAVSNGTVTTDVSGNFTIAGLATGTYNIAIKHPKYLRTVQEVTIVDGSNSYDFGTLTAGDANNDNVVDDPDFAILSVSFGLSSGDDGYDDRADFDGDGEITSFDFTLLSINFDAVGSDLPE